MNPVADATFDDEPASAATIERATALHAACERHGVALPAAALVFALRHRAVSAVVIGAHDPGEIRDDVAWAQAPVPTALGDELDALP